MRAIRETMTIDSYAAFAFSTCARASKAGSRRG
jgi:hypothetical protein